MLLNIRFVVLAGELPSVVAGNDVAVCLAETFRAGEGFGNIILTIWSLPAVARDVDAAVVLVINRKVVVTITVVGSSPDLSSAQTDRGRGVRPQGPVGQVEIVDMLLDDMIAANPGEVIPVAELILHIRLPGLAGFHPDAALIPVNASAGDLAEGAVLEAFHSFEIPRLVPSLRSDANGQTLSVRLFVGFESAADAWAVHAHRLFGEDVFSGGDGGFQVHGAESRRSGENHGVYIAGQQLLEGIEPNKLAVLGDVHLVGIGLGEVGEAFVEAVAKDVAHGNQLEAL